MTPDQLRAFAAQLLSQVETMGRTVETMGKKINRDQTVIEKLTHEIAQLKRLKFAKRSEQLNPQQASLLDDLIDTDIAAIEAELQALQTAPAATEKKQKPKRTALPAEFPRTLIHHEPDNTHCPCGCALKRIGEDVSEKLDYTPGVFTVERHVRGKWVCDDCETLIQAPVPAQILEPDLRCRIRQEKAVPVMDRLHAWMIAQRDLVPEGSAISRALDYSLKRWEALSRYLDDGAVPIDNNWAENQIRPWALGRKNWLFAGSLRSGKRAAAIMSLIQSARLNGHDPYAYLKDVLTRLPTQQASEISELLPHRWTRA